MTIKADDKEKVAGQADPPFTYSVTADSLPLVNGDTLTGVTCGVAVAHGTAGTYDIVCSGNTNTNYNVTYVKGTLTVTSAACAYTAAFQSPIRGDMRNLAKAGSVVPVKLRLTDCNGVVVTNRKLEIRVLSGIVETEDVANGAFAVAETVSSADTTGFMRVVDGQYMYNLSTKGLANNADYSVVIKDVTDQSWTVVGRLATAVIRTQK